MRPELRALPRARRQARVLAAPALAAAVAGSSFAVPAAATPAALARPEVARGAPTLAARQLVTGKVVTRQLVTGQLVTGQLVTGQLVAGQLGQLGQVPSNEASSNWSGYEDTGVNAQFTQVSAAWTVPTLETGIDGSSSTWVGIDGTASTSDLVQAGTEQDWTVSGPRYYAWYELLPGSAVDVGNVNPGDRVSADIRETSPGEWALSITDATSGTAWDQQVSYDAPGTSAEWIVEAPTNTSTDAAEPLAPFGSVTFSQLSATGPSTAGTEATPVFFVHPGDEQIEAYPGPYNPPSDSFTDYFGNPSGVLATSPVAITGPTSPATAAGSGRGEKAVSWPEGAGYWLVGAKGGVFPFGDARYYGSTGAVHLRQPVVAVVPATAYRGYWLVAKDGGVFGFGGAPYKGSLPALGIQALGTGGNRHERETSPIVAAAPAPDGKGYWMVSENGAVFAFGDAHYRGSCTGSCPAPVKAIIPAAGGGGYWLLLSDCQMVPEGSAPKIASPDCEEYAKSHRAAAVAAARTPSGRGYWVLLSNGAVFAEGDANGLSHWEPPAPAAPAGAKAVALVLARDGAGAWVVFADGTVKTYGDAPAIRGISRAGVSAPVVAGAGW